MYGPVRTVVWEGEGREAFPYPDYNLMYVLFKVPPFHKNIARAIQKAPKFYFYDTGQVDLEPVLNLNWVNIMEILSGGNTKTTNCAHSDRSWGECRFHNTFGRYFLWCGVSRGQSGERFPPE